MSGFEDLLTPGGQRAWPHVRPERFLELLLRTEQAWVLAQRETGLAAREAAEQALAALGEPTDYDLERLAAEAEGGANPVIGLVRQARSRGGAAAETIHRGLTSQDVMDTALMLLLRDAARAALTDLSAAGERLAELTEAHRASPMMARTLGQYAQPSTFGARAASWLTGLAEAADGLEELIRSAPAGLGGAAGQLGDLHAWADPQTEELIRCFAEHLDLRAPEGIWQARRTPLLSAGTALAETARACGRIGADTGVAARSEIAELQEPAAPGRGGSYAMAHKRNPVLSLMLRRSALAAAGAEGMLRQAASLGVEERADFAWHAEWAPLRQIAQHALIGASVARELLEGLSVRTEAMAARVAEHETEAGTGAGGVGLAPEIADAAVARWRARSAGTPPHPTVDEER